MFGTGQRGGGRGDERQRGQAARRARGGRAGPDWLAAAARRRQQRRAARSLAPCRSPLGRLLAETRARALCVATAAEPGCARLAARARGTARREAGDPLASLLFSSCVCVMDGHTERRERRATPSLLLRLRLAFAGKSAGAPIGDPMAPPLAARAAGACDTPSACTQKRSTQQPSRRG